MLRQAAIAHVEHEHTVAEDHLAEVQELDLMERVDTTELPPDQSAPVDTQRIPSMKGQKVVPLIRAQTARTTAKKQALINTTSAMPTDLPGYLIKPNSGFYNYWDYVMIVALAYTAVVTPFELGFLSSRSVTPDWGMYAVNFGVNLMFIVDIIVNLLTPFQENGLWVTSLKLIAFHYLRGFLILDMLSCLPIDTITVLQVHFSGGSGGGGGCDPASVASLLRLLKLFKIVKLLRLSRLAKIIERFEERTAVSFATRKIGSYIVLMIMLAHWFACLDRLVIDLDNWPGACGRNETTLRYTHPNWLEMYLDNVAGSHGMKNFPCDAALAAHSCMSLGACGDRAAANAEAVFASDPDALDMNSGEYYCFGVWQEYLVAVYWSTMTITTIGYGDVGIVTDVERATSTFNMLVGGFIYAYIVGAFCGTVASMDELKLKFQRSLDDLNRFMEAQPVKRAWDILWRPSVSECMGSDQRRSRFRVHRQGARPRPSPARAPILPLHRGDAEAPALLQPAAAALARPAGRGGSPREPDVARVAACTRTRRLGLRAFSCRPVRVSDQRV